MKYSSANTHQHSKRKRIFADRYAMTNIMKEKPMAVINERATTFVSKCVEAGQKSVDVYVSCQEHCIQHEKG